MSEEPQTYGTGQLRALLRDRHLPKRGRPEWAYLEEVRNAPGFDATRSLDALAVHLWPSRGHEIHGYEIKCSRSDWLRELKDPHKAEAFSGWCDRFWIVAAPGIVRDELPIAWGLLEPKGQALRVVRQAKATPASITPAERARLACILAAAGKRMEVSPDQAAVERLAEKRVENIRTYFTREIEKRADNYLRLDNENRRLIELLRNASQAVRQVTGGWDALDSDNDRARFLRNLKCAQSHNFEHVARSWLVQMRAITEGLANSHRFAAQVNNEQAERLQQCLDSLSAQKNSYVPDLDTMQPLLDWLQAAEDQLAEVAS